MKKFLECSLAAEEMIEELRLYLIEGVGGLVELVTIGLSDMTHVGGRTVPYQLLLVCHLVQVKCEDELLFSNAFASGFDNAESLTTWS